MKTLILFDVDGTLTDSRQKIKQEMVDQLYETRKKYDIGIVGGSDIEKQIEQIGNDIFDIFKWVFSENGTFAYKYGKLFHKKSIINELGDEKYNDLINYCLQYISNLNIPKKRGHFIELRNGMINVSPIGRSCSYEERIEFYEYDKINKIREKMIQELETKFDLKFSIGGQISIDIFPKGWDKTYCLQHIYWKYDKIIFFGDKVEKDGNDYEIYNHPEVIGYKVNNYNETINILKNIDF